MKTTILALFTVLFLGSPVLAHDGSGGFGAFGDLGDFGLGGFGFGGHHGQFGGFDGLGGDFGLGFFNADQTQTRFENQFDTLKTKYDDGVAGSTDFFSSTDYDNIVSKTERLDDRYGLFVSGVQRSIDRITDLISTTNDDITYFNKLLADYQADTSLSAARLDRIELTINHITDGLNSRVDSLTSTQSALQTNLPTYQSFQTDISKFLSDIQAAGGGTSGSTSSSLLALASSSMVVQGAMSSDHITSATSGTSLSPAGVPEPTTVSLAVLTGGAMFVLSRRRVHRRIR